ncbi:hypothetical protein BC936DRAFT_144438 [Jimgerdemannia flammicorona]|uniref:NodB homology domain-containing protein n=1 Tax=Jimgerdemannia flammicorona TaxID=994334 RepID=A0A433DCF7_9FUNG|nr:hypothetical protein BC936DRAFT_144438 [Jimgerdemannia flammicorona]
MLNKYNVTATFFVNGDNYVNILDKKYRAAVKFAYDSGHQIASHTWDHKDLAKLSTKAVKEEMTKLEPAFKTIIGKVPSLHISFKIFQGSINDGANAVITSLGYRIIIWTFDSEDCDHPTDVKKDMANYQANLKGLKAASTYGFIALEHDVYKDTALVFAEQAVKYVQSLGYKMVSVAECLGDKGHEYRA